MPDACGAGYVFEVSCVLRSCSMAPGFSLRNAPLANPPLGSLVEDMDNFPCALLQHERVLSVYEWELPEKDPCRIMAMGRKAGALIQLDRLDESLSLYEDALNLGRQVFERDSDNLFNIEGNLAMTSLSSASTGQRRRCTSA